MAPAMQVNASNPTSIVATAPIQPPIAVARAPSPGQAAGRRKAAPSATKPSQITIPRTADAYYGFREMSKTACGFITSLFSCPLLPPPSTTGTSNTPELTVFIAYAIHRTRLPEAVVFTSLFLLARLKERFPAARGSSGHRLFISAFMIASKVICDDTYSNKSWCIVAQNLYSLKEVNQMEREMCSYLEWILHVDAKELEIFTDAIRRMYASELISADKPPVPWCGLRAILPPPAKASSSPISETSSEPTPIAIPALPSTPVSIPAVQAPSAPVVAPVAPELAPIVIQSAPAPPAKNAYPSPESESSPPSPSHSDSASPASSVSCLNTPPNGEDAVSISGATGAPTPNNANHPQKLRTSQAIPDPSFAFAGPTVW